MSRRRAISKLLAITIIVIVVVAVVAGVAAYMLYMPKPAPEEIPTEIRIGTVQHLSGPLAMLGHYALEGLKIGVQWVNDRGGINYKDRKIPVRLIYYDTESKLEYAIKLTEKLIVEDKIHFLVAGWTPEYVIATTAVAERHNIVTVSPGGGADVEYQQGFKYMIQYGIHGSTHFQVALRFIREVDPAVKRIAFFTSAADVGGAFITSIHKAAEKWGYEIIYEKVYPEDITDASPILREVAALKPDIIVGGTFPASGMLIASQMKDLKVYAKYVLLNMVVDKVDFGQTFGKYAVGFMLDSNWEPEAKWEIFAAREGKEYVGPTNDEIVAYWRKMGREERVRTEAGMAAIAPPLIAKLIEMTQSLRPDDIIKAALQLDCYTCRGRFKLDPTNPARQIGLDGKPVVIQWQKKDNKLIYAILYPYEFANSKLIPMPTWEEKGAWPELVLEIK